MKPSPARGPCGRVEPRRAPDPWIRPPGEAKQSCSASGLFCRAMTLVRRAGRRPLVRGRRRLGTAQDHGAGQQANLAITKAVRTQGRTRQEGQKDVVKSRPGARPSSPRRRSRCKDAVKNAKDVNKPAEEVGRADGRLHQVGRRPRRRRRQGRHDLGGGQGVARRRQEGLLRAATTSSASRTNESSARKGAPPARPAAGGRARVFGRHPALTRSTSTIAGRPASSDRGKDWWVDVCTSGSCCSPSPRARSCFLAAVTAVADDDAEKTSKKAGDDKEEVAPRRRSWSRWTTR